MTQSMLSNNMLRHLMNNQSQMEKYMNQLSTGKKISRPSDDPVIAMKGMNFRTQVSEVEQFKRNVGEVHNWMDNSDAALDKATQAMHRLSELAVQASNDTYDTEERQSILEEVEQLKEHLVDIANTNVNGKYIFNGTNTGNKAVTINDDGTVDATQINSKPVKIEVSKGTALTVNVNANEVFNTEFFNAIEDFEQVLRSGDETEEEPSSLDDSIAALNNQTTKIVDARANLGARMNRLELVENRLAEQEVIAKKTMSENEDIHFEEAITNLITQESLHRAALSAGSRIIQPTLVDFLR